MLQRLRRSWPVLPALILLGAMVAWDAASLADLCQGEVPYGLDDSYIHLGLARQLVEDGTFGLNPGEVAPLSSSLLWTALLVVGLAALGLAEGLPGWLALASGVGALLLAEWALRERPAWVRVVAGLVVVAGTPLAAQVVLGMEHALHGALALAWLLAAGKLWSRRGGLVGVAVLSALLTLTRYEGLLLVGPLALGLLATRRWREALVVGATGALPLLGYGAFSAAHGWWWLPTGVVLKTGIAPAEPWRWPLALLRQAGWGLAGAPWVAALVGGGAVIAWRRRDPALVLWVIGGTLHLLLSRTGEFTRYEAWIVMAGVPLLGRSARGWELGLLLALSLGLGVRGWTGGRQVRLNAAHVWRHQVQVGRFLGARRPGAVVATTEAGALSWYADARFVDLAGLANLEAARLIRSRNVSTQTVGALCEREGVEIVPIFAHWMQGSQVGGVPTTWIPVAQWADPQGRPHPQGLTVYATSEEEAEALWGELEVWEWPAEVRVVRARGSLDSP